MPFTTNKILSTPTSGSLVGLWGVGDPESLNTGVTAKLDKILGGVHSEALSSSNETLSASEAENLVIRCTGTLLANVTITTPGIGFYIVDNQTTGAFTLTLQYTGAVGGTPVMPQGGVTLVAIDATNGVRIVLPGDLLAIEQLTATTGILKKTAANTWSLSSGVTDLADTTANRLFGTDGSGVSGLVTLGGSLSLAAAALAVVAATKAKMEAQASTNPTYPSVQQYHPLHPKAHCRVSSAGALESGSAGITSAARTADGTYTVTMTTAMANTNYTSLVCPTDNDLSRVASAAASSTTVIAVRVRGTTGGSLADGSFALTVFGTQ